MTKPVQSLPARFAFWGTAAAAALICLSIAAAQGTDRVRLANSTEAGEVVKMTPTSISVDRNGTTREIEVPAIRSVVFAGEPPQLTQARLNATNGGFESALESLSKIPADAATRPYIAQEIAFYKAYCSAKLALLGAKPIPEAGSALNSFVQQNSQNFHVLQATELLGDLLVAMGRFENAQQKYEVLARAPWPSYQLRAKVLVGQVQLAQQKYPDALQSFESALAIPGNNPEMLQQQLAGKLGKGMAIAGQGDVKQGVAIVSEVIRDADPENADLLARAYNALGSCHEQAGSTKDALFAYLHVDLLYARSAEAHAEALFHLVTLWEAIGQESESRAARQLLQERYPATRWNSQLAGQ